MLIVAPQDQTPPPQQPHYEQDVTYHQQQIQRQQQQQQQQQQQHGIQGQGSSAASTHSDLETNGQGYIRIPESSLNEHITVEFANAVHCPWVVNCVGQNNYKYFVLFIFYTAIHCVFIFFTMLPIFIQRSDDSSWKREEKVIGLILSGIFGATLVAFTISHVRLILLNRTTIEDLSTPPDEGILPCLRPGWKTFEGDENLGNERLYDMGPSQNWKMIMGTGWRAFFPVRGPRPEGDRAIMNQKVLDKQWRDYYATVGAYGTAEAHGHQVYNTVQTANLPHAPEQAHLELSQQTHTIPVTDAPSTLSAPPSEAVGITKPGE
ncbi:hypothetical protein BGW41_001783 [Actinomortierella wolfii]|nr:hypothetical protein BGW41_001783 [Actinomortierella wolfii]